MKPTIVLLGDWYIDENWLVSPQELYHSAATGKIHYLARHKTVGEKITNLCASAALLETIKSYLERHVDHVPDLVAYGAWNPDDDSLIRRILRRTNQEDLHLSPFTLSNTSTSNGDRVNPPSDYPESIINLATDADRESVSTNRTIRCFQGHGGAMPEQLYRFDWILPLGLQAVRYERIREDLSERLVEAVIVVDHGTGLVNEDSVRELSRSVKNKHALWFVRTKITDPAWLEVLIKRKIRLEMNVIDFRLAARRKGARRWWYGRHLGRAALELLGEMNGSHTYRDGRKQTASSIAARNAVVFLDDNTAFAIAQTGKHEGQYQCISLNQPPGAKQIINLGRTTIFCASLFAQRLRAHLGTNKTVTSSERLGWECSQALLSAYRWSKHASQKWSREEFSLYDDYNEALSEVTAIDELPVLPAIEARPWNESDYDEQWQLWNDSSHNLGIVQLRISKNEGTHREVLQLWRGEGVLKGYICVGGPKRNAINHLVSTISQFKGSNWKHSLSCLVTSPPGWGKSFLAKCLARHFDMEFLEFSIAQMCTNHDVMDAFATIASVQSKSDRPTLIFMDEVNAPIEGHSVLPLLLSPLWGGTFVKDRQSLRLRPSVWIFASTTSAAKFKTDDKGSDFLSRLNGPISELDAGRQHWGDAITKIRDQLHSDNDADWNEYRARIYGLDEYKKFHGSKIDSLKTEQVYLLVSLLDSRWGPISRVERRVLELFRDLLPINGSRSLEIFTSCFQGIKRGEVITANLPDLESSAELRRHIVVPSHWPAEGDGKPQFVDIETRIV